jgi:O-antigen ligase
VQLSSFVIVDKTDESPQAVLPQKRTQRILQNVLVVGLFVLLAFGVLAFGAVDEWSTFTFEAGAAILFLVWAAQQVVSGQVTLSKNPLYLPAALFFVLILAQILLRTTAYGYITRYEAMRYLAYGIVMLVAAECVRGEELRKKVAFGLLAFGTAYAFFALVQEFAPNRKIFWLYTPHYNGSIYGSYVNHNHYAGLMEMLIPVPLCLSLGHLFKGGKRAMIAFAAVLMASTVFLARSRGGMISFLLQLAILAALTLWQNRDRRIAIGLLAVCLSVLFFLFFIGRGQVLGRLGELDPGMRIKITTDCIRMFLHHPIAGSGLGTFPTVYPRDRTFSTTLFINQAHNDYVQLLVETGLLGVLLMAWFLARLYRRATPTSRRWEFKWEAALSLAALLGCTGILFHSFVDFNLHIPANAALFYALAGLSASELSPSSSRSHRKAVKTEGVEALP